MAGRDVRDLARIEAPRELAADLEKEPKLARQSMAAGQVAGGLEGGCRLVGEDGQEAQVVSVELIQSELREGDHADDHIVIAHRHDEHRFIDIVRARDRRTARIVVRISDEKRLPMLPDPAREAHAEASPE